MSVPASSQEAKALLNAPFFEQSAKPYRGPVRCPPAPGSRSPSLKRTSTMVPSPLIQALLQMLKPVPCDDEFSSMPNDSLLSLGSQIIQEEDEDDEDESHKLHEPSTFISKPSMPVSLIDCGSSLLSQPKTPDTSSARTIPPFSLPAPHSAPASSPAPTLISMDSPLTVISSGLSNLRAASAVSLPGNSSNLSILHESDTTLTTLRTVSAVSNDAKAHDASFQENDSGNDTASGLVRAVAEKPRENARPLEHAATLDRNATNRLSICSVHSDKDATPPGICTNNSLDMHDPRNPPAPIPMHLSASVPVNLTGRTSPQQPSAADRKHSAFPAKPGRASPPFSPIKVVDDRRDSASSPGGTTRRQQGPNRGAAAAAAAAATRTKKEKRFSFRQMFRLPSKSHSLEDAARPAPVRKSKSQSDILQHQRPPPKLASSLFISGFRRHKNTQSSTNSSTASLVNPRSTSKTPAKPQSSTATSKSATPRSNTSNLATPRSTTSNSATPRSTTSTLATPTPVTGRVSSAATNESLLSKKDPELVSRIPSRPDLSHYIRAVSDSPNDRTPVGHQDSRGPARPENSVDAPTPTHKPYKGDSLPPQSDPSHQYNRPSTKDTAAETSPPKDTRPELASHDFNFLDSPAKPSRPTAAAPVPTFHVDFDELDVSPGDSLFPKSLNPQEVESIVSLERLRLMRSVNGATKRNSFINYDGSDDNIIQFQGPNHHPLPSIDGVTRTGSILKKSLSGRVISLDLLEPAPRSRSRSPSCPATPPPNGDSNRTTKLSPIAKLLYSPELDRFDFSEFGDFMGLDNLSLLNTPRLNQENSPAGQHQPTPPQNEPPTPATLASPPSESRLKACLFGTEISEPATATANRTPDLISLSSPPNFAADPSSNWGGIPPDSDTLQVLDIFGESAYESHPSPKNHTWTASGLDQALSHTQPPSTRNPHSTPSQSIGQGFGTSDDEHDDDDLSFDDEHPPPFTSTSNPIQAWEDVDDHDDYPIEAPPKLHPQGNHDLASDLASVSLSHHLFGLILLRRWKRLPHLRHSPPPNTRATVRFSSRIILYDTFHEDDYDRHPDIATCNQLTPQLARDIKDELNELKREMVIHPDLQCYTHYF